MGVVRTGGSVLVSTATFTLVPRLWLTAKLAIPLAPMGFLLVCLAFNAVGERSLLSEDVVVLPAALRPP